MNFTYGARHNEALLWLFGQLFDAAQTDAERLAVVGLETRLRGLLHNAGILRADFVDFGARLHQ